MNINPLTFLLFSQSALCCMLVLFRNFHLGYLPEEWAGAVHLVTMRGPTFLFLGWNLFLAWVPYWLSTALSRARGTIPKVGLLLLWLLFFPNAPYIITDLIHLRPHHPIPIWYDALVFFSAAWTGLLLGYCSLLRVGSALRQWWGASYARAFSVMSLLLCVFGIYLGRFLRWNSWDALLQPLALLRSISGLLSHPPTLLLSLGIAMLLSTLLGLGYFTIYTISKSEFQ